MNGWQRQTNAGPTDPDPRIELPPTQKYDTDATAELINVVFGKVKACNLAPQQIEVADPGPRRSFLRISSLPSRFCTSSVTR